MGKNRRISLPTHSATAHPCGWPGCQSRCGSDEFCRASGDGYVRGHYACALHRSVNGRRGPCDACVTAPTAASGDEKGGGRG